MSYLLNLLDLPDIVLETIFLNLSYDEIARLRVVCKKFDYVCRQLLNKGFLAAERYHSHSLKAVKVQLPRRESERRLHPMARHCDILTAIETRLSMLSMTFMKYVDVGLCCFIPGKVIDEIFRVLRYLKESKCPPRAHEILQELRDISSMAMEHFDEKIAPELKSTRPFSSAYPVAGSSGMCTNPSRPFFTQERLRLEFQKFKWREQRNKSAATAMRTKMKQQSLQISVQTKKLYSQATRIAKQENQITEMKRTLAELEHKFGDVIGELSCVREENAVLAATLGIVFNRTVSPQQVSSRVKQCTSHVENNEKYVTPDTAKFSDNVQSGSVNHNKEISNDNSENLCKKEGHTSVLKTALSNTSSKANSLRAKRALSHKAIQKKFKSAVHLKCSDKKLDTNCTSAVERAPAPRCPAAEEKLALNELQSKENEEFLFLCLEDTISELEEHNIDHPLNH